MVFLQIQGIIGIENINEFDKEEFYEIDFNKNR